MKKGSYAPFTFIVKEHSYNTQFMSMRSGVPVSTCK